MKKFLVFPQLFAGGHSVTVVGDSHMTAASASSTSDVQADATVTLTLTPASGYEVAEVEVLAGGVKVYQDDDTISFTMGSSNVVISVKSQKNNEYKIAENCWVCVNGSATQLRRNLVLEKGDNGAILDVDCTPTALTISADVINSLIKAGVLKKNHPAWKGEPTPST